MGWVMRIQNQMFQDMFDGSDYFPILHDISNLFMPSFGAMALPEQIDSLSPKGLLKTSHGSGEIVKIVGGDGKESKEAGEKMAPVDKEGIERKMIQTVVGEISSSNTITAASDKEPSSKATSGPIAIPKQQKVKESGSISDHDSDAKDDGVSLDGDDEEKNGNDDEDDDDDDEGGRSRNPVRRVNSSPEMSSNYRNPYLMAQNKQKEHLLASNSSGSGDGGGEDGTGSELMPNQQQMSTAENTQWKKGFSKDMRVSCEAIPEEMSGQTPPSKVGSVASNEGVLAEMLLNKPGTDELPAKPEKKEITPVPVKKIEEVVVKPSAGSTTVVAEVKPETTPLKSPLKRQSMGGVGGEELKIQTNLKIPPEKVS